MHVESECRDPGQADAGEDGDSAYQWTIVGDGNDQHTDGDDLEPHANHEEAFHERRPK